MKTAVDQVIIAAMFLFAIAIVVLLVSAFRRRAPRPGSFVASLPTEKVGNGRLSVSRRTRDLAQTAAEIPPTVEEPRSNYGSY